MLNETPAVRAAGLDVYLLSRIERIEYAILRAGTGPDVDRSGRLVS
jgi:hypothetical protein